MQVIGELAKTSRGFEGIVRTLRQSIVVQVTPNEKLSNLSPDFLVKSRGAEIGSAFVKYDEKSRKYLEVWVDDPSFDRGIQCEVRPWLPDHSLAFDEAHAFAMLWTRPGAPDLPR